MLPAEPDPHDELDIHAAEFALDPYPAYAALRASCPVMHSSKYMEAFGGFWLLTRYDDVKRAAVDWRTFTSSVAGVTAIPIITQRTEPALPLEVDPPLHARYRALMAPVFSEQRVAQLRPRVEAIAAELWAALAASGGGEMVQDYAVPLSVRTLAEFTGLPRPDIGRWVSWIRRMFNVHDRPDGAQASTEFADYIRVLIAARRQAPTDDFLSLLMAQEVDGHRLNDDEILSFAAVLFGAGFETTADTLSVMLGWLAEHPAERQDLYAHPEKINAAVEEFLRYSSAIQIFGRNASHAVDLHGRHIRAGDVVALAFGSANHDPAVFSEPEQCRLDRAPNPHLTFGAGVHLCLGAPIARLEMAVTLHSLVQGALNFMVAPQSEVVWKTRGDRRGLQALPIQLNQPSTGGNS